ncbi:transcription factor 7-like 1 isoform X1 [Corythoichthys intestinalis]|uniref:transcription factor 7-like 1 isoform X1 n=1 Tax=Corythoichthys intestinalis TaxID=161448 RepID=UPI0025A52025|nr:transcription factor 7-like 1 isoform X1 [Corythoichthys intestinalis]XP_057674466.1 transcription factor 7-like 1 isoform X1 [Corythoichthys intestinalis]XP_057674467.1 transcription factor 7-like 1 isoform X1 [Corythoichthys intestinalis]
MEKLREEFEQIVGELEWQDVAATLQELCSNVMSDPTPTTSPHLPSQNPSSNPNLSPVFGLSLDVRPQPARLPARLPFIPPAQLVALPSMRYGPQFNPYIMQPFYLSRQPGGPFRHQFLPCQVPAHVVQSQGAFTFTSAPAQQKKNLPVVPLPEGATLRAVGMLNGEVLYAAVDASQAAPPPLPAASFTAKRTCKRRRKLPGVKKPPNAFMCFLREQRLAMKSQLENMDSAAVNKLLAQLWTSLNKEQQAKYYEQAFVEKKLHEQMSSEASSGDQDKSQEKSQGPKNKRQRVSTTAQHNANAWNAADDGLSSSSPASPSSSSSPSPSSSSSTTSSVSSASSSSLSSLADATAEGGDTAVSPSAMPRPPDKCPNSGDESDIDGMDAQLLHLLGCC